MKRNFRFPWDPLFGRDIPIHRDLLPTYEPWSWRNGSEWFWVLISGIVIILTISGFIYFSK